MRMFYQAFPIRNAVRTELSWTHYRILMVMQVKTVAKKSRDEQTLYTNIFCDLGLLI